MSSAPSKNLTMLAWGMLLVVLDLRIDDIDLVPDPLGWALGATACAGLTAAVGRARTPARVGFVAETVVVFGTGIMTLVPSRRDTANVVRWLDLATGLTLLVLMALAAWAPALAASALLTGLLALVVFVWYLGLLLQSARSLRLPRGQPSPPASHSRSGGPRPRGRAALGPGPVRSAVGRDAHTTESGSSFLPVGPISISVSMAGQTPQS